MLKSIKLKVCIKERKRERERELNLSKKFLSVFALLKILAISSGYKLLHFTR
jgi:hypothetical protein